MVSRFTWWGGARWAGDGWGCYRALAAECPRDTAVILADQCGAVDLWILRGFPLPLTPQCSLDCLVQSRPTSLRINGLQSE